MTDDDLIARLRKCGNGMGSFKTNQGDYGLCDDAADRIEALVKERDAAEHLARMRKAFIEEARDERDEATNQLDSARHSVDVLEKRVAHFMSRAERLEAALREILEKPRNADLTYAELFAEVVSEARAALKGADHE